jgi:hypothetical protein
MLGGIVMKIKIPVENLPNNFKVEFIEPCPTCSSPMVFGESDTGFNTLTSGEICCYEFVQHIIKKMQKYGFLEMAPTNIDVVQAEVEE